MSGEGVAARYELVLQALIECRMPTFLVTSGGYTAKSHELIARLALRVLEQATTAAHA